MMDDEMMTRLGKIGIGMVEMMKEIGRQWKTRFFL